MSIPRAITIGIGQPLSGFLLVSKEQPLFLRTLVENLERALKESGRTQKAMLAEANIDRETLRQWRSGKTEPGIYKLWRFAEACGVSVGSLIDEKGALNREERLVLEALRGETQPQPTLRETILAVVGGERPEPTHQLHSGQSATEDQGSHQADSG